MPISFGTSTSVIGLPALSGAPVGWPPYKGLAAAAAAGPASQASGLVERSSPPSHLSAATATPPAIATPRITSAAVFIVRCFMLCFIMVSSLKRRFLRLITPSARDLAASVERTCDQRGRDQDRADDDDGGVALDPGQRQPVLQQLNHDQADDGSPDRPNPAENAGAAENHGGDDVEFVAASHV